MTSQRYSGALSFYDGVTPLGYITQESFTSFNLGSFTVGIKQDYTEVARLLTALATPPSVRICLCNIYNVQRTAVDSEVSNMKY